MPVSDVQWWGMQCGTAPIRLQFPHILFLSALVVTCLLVVPVSSAVTPDVEWAQAFGGAFAEWGNAVVSTPDGGYLLAGDARSTASVVSSDVWLVKTSSSGSLVWERRFGGKLYENARSVITTANGGYAVAGTTLSFSSGGGQDAWLICTDNSGTELWNQSYGSYGTDAFESVVQTADGGFAAAGVTS